MPCGLPGRPRADGASTAAVDDPVLRVLPPAKPCDLDAIAERTGLAPRGCCRGLFELEMQGRCGASAAAGSYGFDSSC